MRASRVRAARVAAACRAARARATRVPPGSARGAPTATAERRLAREAASFITSGFLIINLYGRHTLFSVTYDSRSFKNERVVVFSGLPTCSLLVGVPFATAARTVDARVLRAPPVARRRPARPAPRAERPPRRTAREAHRRRGARARWPRGETGASAGSRTRAQAE